MSSCNKHAYPILIREPAQTELTFAACFTILLGNSGFDLFLFLATGQKVVMLIAFAAGKTNQDSSKPESQTGYGLLL